MVCQNQSDLWSGLPANSTVNVVRKVDMKGQLSQLYSSPVEKIMGKKSKLTYSWIPDYAIPSGGLSITTKTISDYERKQSLWAGESVDFRGLIQREFSLEERGVAWGIS